MTAPMADNQELLKRVATEFFRWWWNKPGSNTDDGFDEWAAGPGAEAVGSFVRAQGRVRSPDLDKRLRDTSDHYLAGWAREVMDEAALEIERLTAALRAPEADKAEVVAWRYRFVTSADGKEWSDWFFVDDAKSIPTRDGQVVQALYATPTAAGIAAPPAGGAPVAWRWATISDPDDWSTSVKKPSANEWRIVEPLYAAPPAASADAVKEQCARALWKLKGGEDAQFDNHLAIKEVPGRFQYEPFVACFTEADIILAALTPPVAGADAGMRERAALTKLAAECHRAKWQFDLDEDYRVSAVEARRKVIQAFNELHRIGDMAMKLRDCALPVSPEAGTAGRPT